MHHFRYTAVSLTVSPLGTATTNFHRTKHRRCGGLASAIAKARRRVSIRERDHSIAASLRYSISRLSLPTTPKNLAFEQRFSERNQWTATKQSSEAIRKLYSRFRNSLEAWEETKIDRTHTSLSCFFVNIHTYFGAISEPCCMSEPMVNQSEFIRVNSFSRTSDCPLHGWGFSHS